MDKPSAVVELYNLYIYFFQSLIWVTFYKILTKKDNFFVMFHVHVYNFLQKVFEFNKKKKKWHTSIITSLQTKDTKEVHNEQSGVSILGLRRCHYQ